MYGNVIVGVDGRQGGADAAALAAALASPEARITLVYVSTVPFASHASTRELDLADDTTLAALLTAERDLCPGEPGVVRVSASTVGAGLEQAAQRQATDLIVVGVPHRHGLTRLLGGDDARSVLRRTPCAVALAPARYAQHPSPVVRVGVACDASPGTEVAVAHAGLIAADRGSRPRALHVVSPRRHLASPGALPRVAGVEVEQVDGTVDERLVEFSRELDLLVCGSRHHRPLRRLAEGSAGEHLARRVRTALLVTPPSDPDALDRWRAVGQPATAPRGPS
jgi:nucleotide-binding universal stress UspA family protein